MSNEYGFKKISKYADDEQVIVPTRATEGSAGYDFYAAEDVIIPPFVDKMENALLEDIKERKNIYEDVTEFVEKEYPYPLDGIAAVAKKYNAQVTLVPTGVKCNFPHDCYLQLSARSSFPLKHWMIVANGVGIIDADYYNNPNNEGHIYFQIVNLLPVPIKIKKGECFGQGVFIPYKTFDKEAVTTKREGGFGSTSDNN